MRLDHLLSKEEVVRVGLLLSRHSVMTSEYRKCHSRAKLVSSRLRRLYCQRNICLQASLTQLFHQPVHLLWLHAVSVAMRIGETPVPIPNTMVKTYPAENTAGATLWEGRWPPRIKGL